MHCNKGEDTGSRQHVLLSNRPVPRVTGFPRRVPRVPNMTDTWPSLVLAAMPCHFIMSYHSYQRHGFSQTPVWPSIMSCKCWSRCVARRGARKGWARRPFVLCRVGIRAWQVERGDQVMALLPWRYLRQPRGVCVPAGGTTPTYTNSYRGSTVAAGHWGQWCE